MHATQCPPRNRLKDYLAGKLDQQGSDLLEQHLLACIQCEQTASEIDHDPDTLVELLQSHPEPSQQRAQSDSVEQSGNSQISWPIIPPAIPQVIASYELVRQLGNGGMGAVYLARHRQLDKNVAIKLLPALPARMPEFVARFQREMRAAGKLEHPAIVRSTDAGEEHGIHFLVMDAIDGLDLSRIARSQSQLTIADACEVARQAALGLSHAHEKGIVHRDIKPSNLMLSSQGEVKILDFGLAQLGFWDHGSAEITTVGQLMGTLDYMAPEQAERGGAVDYRADLYSLGATLFRLLTGRPPLAAAPDLTPLEKLRLLSTHRAPKLATLRADVSPELSAIVDAFLSRDPVARPASAAHAAELLEPFCKGAELVSLLARARSSEVATEANQPRMDGLLPHNVRAMTLASPNQQPSRGAGGVSTGSRIVTFGSLALGLGMLCAGIFFVLETSKGQLVIESDNADVQVTLRKDGQELDALHIQPGTQATRLQGGKYEIVIDAPSDNFTVSNQEFTIRNGETVVAKITSKSSTVTPSAIINALHSSPTDKRLDEVVYNGESLDVWLRRLKFERSQDKLEEALMAVRAMANESVNDLIDPVLMKMLSDPNTGSGLYRHFLTALYAVSGESRYHERVATALTELSGDAHKQQLLDLAAPGLVRQSVDDVEQLQPLLTWGAEVLQDDHASPELQQKAAQFFFGLLHDIDTGRRFPKECQQAVLDVLKASKRLTDREFWLAAPQGTHAVYLSLPKPWLPILREEVVQRAIDVIDDQSSDEQSLMQAALVLGSAAMNAELLQTQQSQLVAALEKRFERAARDPKQELELIPIAASVAVGVEPILQNADWNQTAVGGRKNRLGNCLIGQLNLVGRFNLQSALQTPLADLHATFVELDLQGSQIRRFDQSSQWDVVLINHFKSDADKRVLVEQFVYLQTGYFLGKTHEELYARFFQARPADVAKEVERLLNDIQFGTPSERQLSILPLYKLVTKAHADRAIPILTQAIIDHAAEDEQFSLRSNGNSIEGIFGLVNALSRITSDQFLIHFSKALAASQGPNRQALLRIDFSKLREFRCTEVEPLLHLLQWSDNVFASEQAADVQIQWRVADMLRSLMRDRTRTIEVARRNRQPYEMEAGPVSDECQREILRHLEQYAQLTDLNFWWQQPVSDSATLPMGKIFRQAMLEHAVTVLKTPLSPESDQLRAHALMIVRDCMHYSDELMEGQRTAVLTALEQLLVYATTSLDAEPVFHQVQETFGFLSEPMLDLPQGLKNVSPKCNTVLLALNLIGTLQAANSLVEPLQKLYDAADSKQITRDYLSGNFDGWRTRFESVKNEGLDHVKALYVQTVFLQTGILLGKELNELKARPSKLKQELADQRLRFIQPGDTLAIYIPGVLPQERTDPPVIQAGTRPPVTGYPVPVSELGEIQLPHLPPFPVQGKELSYVREIIGPGYTERGVIKDSPELGITVQFLMRAGEQLELHNITGQAYRLDPNSEK